MEVLRGPSTAQHPFNFWLVQDGEEQGDLGQVGRDVEEETVDLQLAVGVSGHPEAARPGRGLTELCWEWFS